MNLTRLFTGALVLAGIAMSIAPRGGVRGLAAGEARAQGEAVPEGVQLLLPRGGIPAVFEPEFVPVDQADISDDAWVLGVVYNGVAKAYSLNLLNHHEIVNDDFGGHPLAAVW